MSYYSGAYQRRLKRFGDTKQEQLQNKRSKEFEAYLAQSAYRIDVCDYAAGTVLFDAILEPKKQDETETTAYLLTRLTNSLNGGALYKVNDTAWMVLYLDHVENSGYNRYTLLKMTHIVKWSSNGTTSFTSPAYFYGEMAGVASDFIKSKDNSPNFAEKNQADYIIMPLPTTNSMIKKDDYVNIVNNINDARGVEEDYLVESYDQISVDGVIYVKLTHTMTRVEKTIDTKADSQSWIERFN